MSFRDRIRSGENLFGTLITMPSTEVVEVLIDAGFDWLFLDLEHSAMTAREAQLLLQVSSGKAPCLVRTESQDELAIRKALDAGAQGIIVPRVNSAEEAQRIVSAAKYPPEGSRSVGLGRAHGYGLKFQEYVETANESSALVIQIEHIEGVRNVDRILEVPGIDAVFVGPYDLSGSMGKLGQVGDVEVQEAIDRVFVAAGKQKIATGVFCASASGVKDFIERGASLIAVGTDALILGGAARKELELLSQLRECRS